MSRLAAPALLLALAAASLAGDRDDLYRALDLERASGRYAEALDLYRKVLASGDRDLAGEAGLGEIRCLRRLGRRDEASRALDAMRAMPLPPEIRAAVEAERSRLGGPGDGGPEAARLATEIERLRQERDGLRAALESEEGSREELERKLAEKEAALSRLAERLVSLPPAPETDEAARQDLERERRLAHREELAGYALSQARALYREGRFEEALEWASRALEFDPANPDAREFRRRLGDAPGGRDHLVREVVRVLDLERRLRLEERRAEVDARLAAGEDLLLRGRLDDAAARFEEVIRLVDAAPSFAPDFALRRAQAMESLERTLTLGARAGAVVPSVPDPDAAGAASGELRELLANLASSDLPGGGRLRVYPLDPVAVPEGAEPAPGTFGRAARPGPAGPLLRTLIPALVHPPAWEEGGRFVRDLGNALVVYAPAEVQDGVAALLRRIAARQDAPVRVTVHLLAAEPTELAAAARRAEAVFVSRGDAAWAVLDAERGRKLREDLLAGGAAETLGSRTETADSGVPFDLALYRSVNLLAPRAGAADPEYRRLDFGFRGSFLAVGAGDGFGVALHLAISGLRATLTLPGPSGRNLQVPALDAEAAEVGVRIGAGQVLAIAGLASPFAADRSALLLLIRPEGGEPASDPTAPEGPAPGPGPVAVDLQGLDAEPPDSPAPLFLGERTRAEESRGGFLLRHLWERLGEDLSATGASLTMNRGVVWVRGDEALVSRVRETVAGLVAARDRPLSFGVRVAALTPAEEGRLLGGLPAGGRVLLGEGVRTFVLTAEDRRRGGLEYFLSGTPGRVPMPEGVFARPSQLVGISRVLRTPFLRGYRAGAGGETWPEYGAVDEGLALELRPLARPGDQVDLTVTGRVARVLERGADTAGARGPEAPVQAISAAKVRAVLSAGDGLLLSGLPAPTPVADRRDRLVLLVTWAGDGEK